MRKILLWIILVIVNVSGPMCLGQMVITFAGDGTDSSIDGWGTLASFNQPTSIISDKNGTLYITDFNAVESPEQDHE